MPARISRWGMLAVLALLSATPAFPHLFESRGPVAFCSAVLAVVLYADSYSVVHKYSRHPAVSRWTPRSAALALVAVTGLVLAFGADLLQQREMIAVLATIALAALGIAAYDAHFPPRRTAQ